MVNLILKVRYTKGEFFKNKTYHNLQESLIKLKFPVCTFVQFQPYLFGNR